MNHHDTRRTWAAFVHSLEKRLASAKRIQAILDEDPELADALIRTFQQQTEPAPAATPTPPSTPRTTHPPSQEAVSGSLFPPADTVVQTLRARLLEYLTARGNRPVSAPILAREWCIHRGTLTNMLYGSTEDFERVAHPEGGKKVLWRLRRWLPTTSSNGTDGMMPAQAEERHDPNPDGTPEA